MTRMEERRMLLETVGSYAAGELSGAEALAAENLIQDNPEHRRLAESYSRMLVMLTALGEEEIEAPSSIADYAVQRAYRTAFLRQAENVFAGLGRSYLDAFVYYLGLRTQTQPV